MDLSVVIWVLAFAGVFWTLNSCARSDWPDRLAWAATATSSARPSARTKGLHNLPEIAGMGLMGLGGLVSIIGGILFLVVMIRAIWLRKPGT